MEGCVGTGRWVVSGRRVGDFDPALHGHLHPFHSHEAFLLVGSWSRYFLHRCGVLVVLKVDLLVRSMTQTEGFAFAEQNWVELRTDFVGVWRRRFFPFFHL